MTLKAVQDDNVQLVTEILDSLNDRTENDAAAAELAKILQEPHFKVLFDIFAMLLSHPFIIACS